VEWHRQQQGLTWNFKEEMEKYCEADVVLLAKAILKFRQIFKNRLDVDPWRYTTLASLCMAIYRGKFLPDKSIVANEDNKQSSMECKEWLLYLDQNSHKDIQPEVTLYGIKKPGDERKHYKFDKNRFVADGYHKKSNTIYEYMGCYFHGCPKCNPECQNKYNKTMERRQMLLNAGYNMVEMWGCEWNKIKKTELGDYPPGYREELEEDAREQTILPREALFGGRTEAFKSYVKCDDNQWIGYRDVVSLPERQCLGRLPHRL
jgi:hypothetical protein